MSNKNTPLQYFCGNSLGPCQPFYENIAKYGAAEKQDQYIRRTGKREGCKFGL